MAIRDEKVISSRHDETICRHSGTCPNNQDGKAAPGSLLSADPADLRGFSWLADKEAVQVTEEIKKQTICKAKETLPAHVGQCSTYYRVQYTECYSINQSPGRS